MYYSRNGDVNICSAGHAAPPEELARARRALSSISKNWECVFDFQYKVAIGQCDGVLIVSNFD